MNAVVAAGIKDCRCLRLAALGGAEGTIKHAVGVHENGAAPALAEHARDQGRPVEYD